MKRILLKLWRQRIRRLYRRYPPHVVYAICRLAKQMSSEAKP